MAATRLLPLPSAIALALALGATAVSAQIRPESLPPDLLVPAQWAGPAATVAPSLQSRTARDLSAASLWLGSTVQIEPARLVDGRWVRPQVNLGLPSESLRGLLREGGLGARQCMLPMVRARTSLSGGDASGALWVYMRCSLE